MRIENLEELVTATKEFIKPDEAEQLSDLTAFLTHASLEAGEEQASPHQDYVEMMTLHSAKGLEFPRVFMVGVEEGLFPSFQSFEEPGRLEEERRLAYVGITRAKQKLTICYAESRRLYAKEERHLPSRFIAELPTECIQEIRLRGTVTRAMNQQKSDWLHRVYRKMNGKWGKKCYIANLGKALLLMWKGRRIILAYKLHSKIKGLNG